MKIYTIGHSNHPFSKLIDLLEARGIVNLVDVRTNPYSRYNQQYNKGTLENELRLHKFRYVYMGKELGGRPDDPLLYKHRAHPSGEVDFLHEVDYQQVMRRPWFQQGIRELLDLAELDKTAIMCSEEDPAACHRHHLIAKYILEKFPEVEIRHIRGDGVEFGARSILKSVNEPPAIQDKLL
jgi:uncharacterized protein (DUF488 family)